MIKKGILIIVSGPSGVGKKTILDFIQERKKVDFFLSISMTTRQKRTREFEGIDYYFVTQEQFKESIENNELLEWAEFAGNFYGTPMHKIEEKLNQGQNVLLEIEVQGAIQVMKKLEGSKYLSIFIIPPSIEELRNRLVKRATESPEAIEARINKADSEMNQAKNYQHVVINDDPHHAAELIEKIILDNLETN